MTRATNAENAFVTNSYNALGQLVSATDYAGTPTTYTYDSLGRLLTQSMEVLPFVFFLSTDLAVF